MKKMNREIKTQQIKRKLSRQKITFGTWISLNCEAIAEIFCKAGFEWIVIDLEHSSLTEGSAENLIRIIDLCGSIPLVRITKNCPHLIKRVMDSGAYGIVVPQVKSAEEAQKAVSATRYAPLGSRGVGLARAQAYGAGFMEYLKWQKNGPIVFIQIEHIDAVKTIDKILAVPGVSGFLIGPYDLSCSLGQPGKFNTKKFLHAEKKILKAGIQQKCAAGIHIVEPDCHQIRKTIKKGYKIIAYSVDIRMLDRAARTGQDALKTIGQ